MIRFKKLRWKNFLSTGNNFSEIDFTRAGTNLIVGENGAGKSTMLDALSFALFGKSHRNITKKQLINSINNKDCVVEVEFTVGSRDYRVKRGIKPNAFEIWKDGHMINQSSHAKEYQEILEKNVLQMSHKSFHQIVVLGSSSFVPFMQLNSSSRRDVIEDLLDINIFSKMNSLLKEKATQLKTEVESNTHSIEVVKTKISSQKKYIRDLTAINTQHRKEKESEIKELQDEISSLNDANTLLSETVTNLLPNLTTELNKVRTSKQKLEQYNSQFKSQVRTVVKEAKFFEDNDHCPTCDQEIGEELRNTKKETATQKAKKLKEAMDKAEEQLTEFNSSIADLEVQLQQCLDDQNMLNNNQQTIERLNRNVDKIRNDLLAMTDSDGDMSTANTELQELEDELLSLNDTKYLLNEKASYNRIAGELLRDTGIKTKIIKQYVPVINELTNKYLQILDFFVHFELDESFNETIRSRFRDAFSYDSFSEGEKQRIDLSLLFTWRQIAKMKNSVSTNLLILDETFDSSLDDDGVDNLMKIIESLKEDTNVFVISHKSELEDAHFERKLEFYKDKNFSKMKEIT
jgi:DNA repair exonuclease SbcCD ATPase subunit